MNRTSFWTSQALRTSLISLSLVAAFHSAPSYALFGDDEARQAILELREQVKKMQSENNDNQQRSQGIIIDQSQRIDQLNQEIARLRGQVELLSKGVQDNNQNQKDLYLDLDTRLKRFEPQEANVDGQTISVSPTEKIAYESALGLFKSGSYADAVPALSEFVRKYPDSPFAPAAQFYTGSSYYALQDYKAAITQEQALVKKWPNNVRAADALLVIAASQAGLGDAKGAKASLEQIVSKYPSSSAATTAKERLAIFKN